MLNEFGRTELTFCLSPFCFSHSYSHYTKLLFVESFSLRYINVSLDTFEERENIACQIETKKTAKRIKNSNLSHKIGFFLEIYKVFRCMPLMSFPWMTTNVILLIPYLNARIVFEIYQNWMFGRAKLLFIVHHDLISKIFIAHSTHSPIRNFTYFNARKYTLTHEAHKRLEIMAQFYWELI